MNNGCFGGFKEDFEVDVVVVVEDGCGDGFDGEACDGGDDRGNGKFVWLAVTMVDGWKDGWMTDRWWGRRG